MTRLPLVVIATVAALAAAVRPASAARDLELPDASFELDGSQNQVLCANGLLLMPESSGGIPWGCSGDVAVMKDNPCLSPQLPSDGAAAVCLSTGSLFGGSPVGGVASSLVSPPVDVDLKAETLIISFDFEFGTDEGIRSVQFNDSMTVTLLTGAGPFPLLGSDTWGTTPQGVSVKIEGDPLLAPAPNPGCNVDLQTSRVEVKARRTIPPSIQDAVRLLPVHLQFQIVDQGDTDRVSFACIDNIRIRAVRTNDND